MILNGKAKEDFEQYVLSKYLEIRFRELVKFKISDGIPFVDYYDICELHLNALIIEWLDSVGIFIYVDIARLSQNEYGCTVTIWYNGFRDFYETENFKDRKEATEKGIEKANEIYNNLNK